MRFRERQGIAYLLVAFAIFSRSMLGQGGLASGGVARGELPQPKTWTAAEDHQNMMDQLGLRALRPGPSGDESAPNHANYDESMANPFPNLPDVLTLKNGKKVSTAEIWWTDRRPEIVRISSARC